MATVTEISVSAVLRVIVALRMIVGPSCLCRALICACAGCAKRRATLRGRAGRTATGGRAGKPGQAAAAPSARRCQIGRGREKLERVMRFELTTFTLAR